MSTVQDNIKMPDLFFDHIDEIKSRLSGKEPFIFLDYDGTLTPIVERPELAVMSDEMREAVKALAQKHKTAIVSGRATDDVRSKVNIDDIFYAGSHGFEIVSPDGSVKVNEEAQALRPVIDEVCARLKEELKSVDGALVEHVKYTISVHYRLASEENASRIKKAAEEATKINARLRLTHGKKVCELRPAIDWDKGKAVEWILNALSFNPQKHLAIYIGDDTTDEDAFGVLDSKGISILVGVSPKETKADYSVENVSHVKKVLEILSS